MGDRTAEDAAPQPKSAAKTTGATTSHSLKIQQRQREREREREAAERRCDLQQRRQQPFRPLWAADEQGSLSRLGSSSLPSAGQSLLVTVF